MRPFVLTAGANRGIGLECARQLIEDGHKVIGTARKPAEAAELKSLGAEALHPGWVKTRLGGAGAKITVDVSVAGMLEVVTGLDSGDSGHFLNYKGEAIPW